jgi:hypothetical protein
MSRTCTEDAITKSAKIIGQINPEPAQRTYVYTAKQWKYSENQSAQKSSRDNQSKAQNHPGNTIIVDGYNAPIGENGAQVLPENIAEPPELKNFQ